MAEYKRKSLTQRVADRKRGIKSDPRDYGRAPKKPFESLNLIGMIFQGGGLLALLVLIGRYISSGYQVIDWDLIIISSVAFLGGRGMTAAKRLMSK